MVEGFLATTPKFASDRQVIALIVPHAGLIYSGQTAAHAFKAIEGRVFKRVIILSPSHRLYNQPLLTSGHQAYETPLGAIPVDTDFLAVLAERLEPGGIALTPVRHDQEHALEIELPFLQVLLPDGFRLVPLMMMDQTARVVKPLAQALAEMLRFLPGDEPTLLVATSDLSHFFSQRESNLMDQKVIDALQAMDADKVLRLNTSGQGQACGHGPIAATLLAAKALGADRLEITDYRTSAAVTHDTSSVVGYASAVLTGPLP